MANHSKKKRNRRYQLLQQANIGKSPGTITVDPEAQKPVIKILCYNESEFKEATITNLDELQKLTCPWQVSWIQVIGLGDPSIIKKIGQLYNLHRLTLEDITNLSQRPKYEQYGEQFFIISRLIETVDDCKESQQVSMFLDKNFVLSFHSKDSPLFEPLKNRIRGKLGRIRYSGADYLCYAILDTIVDQYFPVLEQVAEKLDDIESHMFDLSRAQILTNLHTMRHDLLSMRRALWPLRDVINNMIRETSPIFAAETKIHLRDCYDHSVQIVDLLESYRELTASLMELSLSLMSHRLNEGIRILTVISTIFIPLNFIAGVYGMNFNTGISQLNMPELNWTWGYPFALMIMLLVTLIQLGLFWKKGWLRSTKATDLQNKFPERSTL